MKHTEDLTSHIFVWQANPSWYFWTLLTRKPMRSLMQNKDFKPPSTLMSFLLMPQSFSDPGFSATLNVYSCTSFPVCPVSSSSKSRWHCHFPASFCLRPSIMMPQVCSMWLSTEVWTPNKTLGRSRKCLPHYTGTAIFPHHNVYFSSFSVFDHQVSSRDSLWSLGPFS